MAGTLEERVDDPLRPVVVPRTALLDTPPEEALAGLTRLAALVLLEADGGMSRVFGVAGPVRPRSVIPTGAGWPLEGSRAAWIAAHGGIRRRPTRKHEHARHQRVRHQGRDAR